ncbi:MAG TPA: amidohydrolase [Gemmataceae bacterium]|nr:amidohydrolase [Gemmataceae bacterium]
MSRSLRVAITLFSLAAGPATLRAADPPADLVVRNGKVLTVNAKFTVAEAVAVRDGVFIKVGTDADIKPLIGDKTRVIDAGGKSIIPGLIESHVHAVGVGRGEVTEPFLQLRSIAEIQDWARKKAATAPAGEWVRLPRVDITRIKERRMPTRAELDAAAPDRPVVFNWQYANRQVQVLNTAALKAAGITRDTPDPKGGKIVKGTDGEPTGVLEDPRELTAKFLPARNVSDKEALDSLEKVHGAYNAVGITSIGERRTNVEGYRAYEKLKSAGRLTVRANVTIGLGGDGTLEGTEKAIRALPFKFADGDDWVRVGPLKIGVDGGVLYGTAFMHEPYGKQAAAFYGLADPDFRGALSLSAEKVKAMIRAGNRLGWQMSAHVTGDAGVDLVLDAIEEAGKDRPVKDSRFNLIHAYFPTPPAVKRAAELGACVDTQPAWYYKDGDALAAAFGGTRLKNFIGLADWRRGGVKVAINSDHMQGVDPDRSLNPYNPFLTMGVAVTRKTETGLVIGPEQRVSREDALRMMTIEAAYLSFDEKKKGSIEVGRLADLAVLADDFLTCDEDRIKDIKVAATVVGGKVVYEAKR